ncbi:MAG: excinuclease ABC subunit C [Halobacteriales archaeon]|jgi:excinuclease ABC subunit C
MDVEALRDLAADLPREPGVYQFLDGDRIAYVGKAVDLRDRVRSYADPRSERVREMVVRADDVDVAVTETETQALLLEANLIKRHQPRYNVRLKDDKSYPLVRLTDHEVPRIEVTRDPHRRIGGGDGTGGSNGDAASAGTVYGPFTDKGRVDTVVKAIREVYGLRGCSDHKYRGRDRPCLDYEMGLCSAPCTGEIDPESYAEDVAAARRFFEGETGVLADPLGRRMEAAAEAERFEEAANLRDRLDAVEAFHGDADDAVAARNDERVVDVLGVAVAGEEATVARLHSENGKLVDRDRHTVAAPEPEVPAVLAAFVPQYYTERDLPDALLLPEHHGDDELAAWLDREGVAVRVPGAGREARLIELALKNARARTGTTDAPGALADALGLEGASRIEGFDVSHAGGKAAVGGDVLFVDGTPEKSGYRRKKLADRNDDVANVRSLVRWRADRAVEGRDDRPDPDLLLIDGGEAQLSAAREALDAARWDVAAIGLAKDEELVVTPDRTYDWADDDPKLSLLRRVRDEAHRFAVQYHQTVRDDVSTALDGVPGVGPETRKRLLRRFGSVDGVRGASEAELREVAGVGEKTARTLAERL